MKELCSEIIKKLKIVLTWAWGIISIVLLLYMISWSRTFVHDFFFVFLGVDWLIRIQNLFSCCLPYLQKLWPPLFVLMILCYFIDYIQLRSNREEYKRKVTVDEGLPGHLYQYITHDDIRCFLLFGSWGVGKSYCLQEFVDQIKHYKIKSVYHISCFGISTRESLLKELQNICEAEDRGFTKIIIELIHKIPIVGDLFYKLLRNNYELQNIKKGSVFIFDDFERIAACEIPNPTNQKPYYKPDASLGNYCPDEMKKEFDNISSALNSIQNHEITATKLPILDGFNIVTGLINELLEYYHMRVIVVANKDKIPPEYFRDTFHQKLTCIKFHLVAPYNILDKLLKEQLDLFVSLGPQKKHFIECFFENNAEDIKNVWEQTNIENMRILANIINSYIDAVDRYDLKYIGKLGISLFYSIFISYIFYQSDNFNILTQIKIGENIVAFWKKDNIECHTENKLCIESSINNCDLRWCGCAISCQWILGHYDYVEIKSIVNDFISYDSEFESSWIKNGKGINPKRVDDWFIFLKNTAPDFDLDLSLKNKIDFNDYSNAFQHDYNLGESKKQKLFNMLDSLGYDEIFQSDYRLESFIFNAIDSVCLENEDKNLYGKIANEYHHWIKEKDNLNNK